MERERFEQHLVGYLYGELDDVTRAAMKRQLEGDADCRELEARLRATVELAELPMLEPSADLEERILAATDLASRGEPWHRKLVRSLSWAGAQAMRPQIAMAAVLLLVLGSSMLLLRATPGTMRSAAADKNVAPTRDPAASSPQPADALAEERSDEADRRGAQNFGPGQAKGEGESPMAAGTAASDGGAPDGGRYTRGLKRFRAGENEAAREDFAAARAAGGADAPLAGLYEARATKAATGCRDAVAVYDGVRKRHGVSGVGADATYEQAECHRELGESVRARELLAALDESPEYKTRAAEELASLGAGTSAGTSAGRAVTAPRKAAAAAPAPPAAAAASAKKAKAAEERAADAQAF